MHSPGGYGLRPVDTGWYAGFGQLEAGVSELVPYATDGSRFAGATYDPSGVYRMRAVLTWLSAHDMGPAEIHGHVARLQKRFLDSGVAPGDLVPSLPRARGNFLTFGTSRAPDLFQALHDRGVITDYRGDRLRVGFGVYHDDQDVDRLIQELGAITVDS